jgi:hypothetical protein
MHLSLPAVAPHSNHTETSAQLLLKQAAYLAAHREYFDYLHLLLDRAALPHCNVHLPNLTTMAAMVEELRELNSAAPWLNAIVMGRLLRRVLPGMLTWHGGLHAFVPKGSRGCVFRETTIYRFSEVLRCRHALATHMDCKLFWSNEFDQ